MGHIINFWYDRFVLTGFLGKLLDKPERDMVVSTPTRFSRPIYSKSSAYVTHGKINTSNNNNVCLLR